MPKPLKKNQTKPKKTRPSDVNQLARQLVEESTAESHEAETPEQDFRSQLSEYMRALGKKGGQISGARRKQNIPEEKRQEIALKAAKARWAKSKERRGRKR